MEKNHDVKETSAAPKKEKFGFRSIIYNNKVAMVVSLLAAFCIWIWVAIEKSPVITTTVHAVPVQIDMENSVPAQLHLQMFGETEYYVDVTVTGKRFIVSALKPEDFIVTAKTNYVDSAGNKSLQLKAVSAISKDFEISALSQNYIDVYFDTYKEAEFAIQPKIDIDHAPTVVDGCILGEVLFSENVVIVSGPSAEVNKVRGVVAQTTLEASLAATTTVQPEIRLVTENEEKLSNVQIQTGDAAITMTMPVLKQVVLPTTVTFKNTPTGYLNAPIPVTVRPSKIEVAIPVEKLEETESISVGTVDFSELDIGYNVFNFKASDVTGGVVSNTSARFKATVNMSGMQSKTCSVPAENISIVNQKDGFTVTLVSKELADVRVLGTTEDLSSVSDDKIYAEVDLANVNLQPGTQDVKVRVLIKNNSKAWASGTYTVRVKVTADA